MKNREITAVTSGGGTQERPHKIGKIVVEIWCYFPEIDTFGVKSKIQKIFSQKCEKVNFP